MAKKALLWILGLALTLMLLAAPALPAVWAYAPDRTPAANPESAGPEWVERTPATAPTSRYAHAMAYDAARGVAVLFGGYDNSYLDDTWEWDGVDWVLRTPATVPPSREFHAMAYDGARGLTVLFGGRGPYTRYDDTWEWDGTNWVLRAPATKPTARLSHRMAYDGARGVTVLFGGWDGGSYLNETWEWDGTSWLQRTPATAPPARYVHAMVYDGARGVTVLFGGWSENTGDMDDTWEWDGVDWVQRSPVGHPSARDAHAMAYDAARGVAVLFGGADADGGYRLNDTWEWDGADWVQSTPASAPLERNSHVMAYDSLRRVTVLFGGHAGYGFLNDTWEYSVAPTFVYLPVVLRAYPPVP